MGVLVLAALLHDGGGGGQHGILHLAAVQLVDLVDVGLGKTTSLKENYYFNNSFEVHTTQYVAHISLTLDMKCTLLLLKVRNLVLLYTLLRTFCVFS